MVVPDLYRNFAMRRISGNAEVRPLNVSQQLRQEWERGTPHSHFSIYHNAEGCLSDYRLCTAKIIEAGHLDNGQR